MGTDTCLVAAVPSEVFLGSRRLPNNMHLPSFWSAVKIKSEEKEEDMKWNNVVGKFPRLYFEKKEKEILLLSQAKENIKCIHFESKKIVSIFIHPSGWLVLAAYVKFKGGSLCSLTVHLYQTTSSRVLIVLGAQFLGCFVSVFFFFSLCFCPLNIQTKSLLTNNKTSQWMKKNKRAPPWFKTRFK